MNWFFKLDLFSWGCSLFFDVLCNNINTFYEYLIIARKCTKYFCFDRSTLFDSVLICLNAETIFPSDDADSVSGMDFHFLHKIIDN